MNLGSHISINVQAIFKSYSWDKFPTGHIKTLPIAGSNENEVSWINLCFAKNYCSNSINEGFLIF